MSRLRPVLFGKVLIVCGFSVCCRAAEPTATEVKVSAFAPVADLEAQTQFYAERVRTALSDKANYDDAAQSRLRKDANTLCALALSLSLHDGSSKYRDGRFLAAARKLASSVDDYDQAVLAAAALKAEPAQSVGDLAVRWEKVADLGALMKQVPVVNSGLKRGMDASRFQRQAEQSAGQSATLAAIAQAAMFDLESVKDPSEADKWRQLCEAMRDAAGEVNTAVHAGNRDQAAVAMKKLGESCDRCHEVFRQKQ